jgi:hypothetical protein
MFLCYSKGVQEFADSLQASKDGILPAKWILSEEDLESGLILMLTILEVGVGAGELIKVIEEEVYLILEVFDHDYLFKDYRSTF